jgi:hypothetical protein
VRKRFQGYMAARILHIFHLHCSSGWEYSNVAIPLQVLCGGIFECHEDSCMLVLELNFTKPLRKSTC